MSLGTWVCCTEDRQRLVKDVKQNLQNLHLPKREKNKTAETLSARL